MFYHMKNMPQSNNLNPAKVNDESKAIVSLPGLSRYNVGLHNSFSISDLAYKSGNNLVIDLPKFESKLGEMNNFTQTFDMPLLGVQIRKDDKVFSFSINEHERLGFGFDKNLIGLIANGNAAYIGQTLNMNFSLDLLHYRDFSFGYSQEIIEGLTVGGKLKFLTGFANMTTQHSTLSFTTQENLEYIEVGMDANYNMSLPATVTNDVDGVLGLVSVENNFEPAGYIANFSNLGFAADLGVNYQTPIEGLSASASVINLGLISWSSNTSNLTSSGEFKWEGIDIGNALNEDSENYRSFEEQIEDITGSLDESINIDAKNDSYSTSIPTRVYLGAEYKINEMFSAGLVDRIMFYDGNASNAITLSANAYFFDIISLTAAYSIIGNTYNNLGIGTAFKLGPVQLFLVTDNILAVTNPLTAKHMNVSLGFNFMFGKK